MSSAAIQTASLSDVGRVRTRNEDCCSEFVNDSGYRLLVVADGMGGHRAGATASRLAVEAIGEVFAESDDAPESMLRCALTAANERVFRMSADDPELRGMGTTAVTLLLGPERTGWVAHVGDSRAYRCRGEKMQPLTRDHSVVAELEQRGLLTPEEAAIHPRRNEILRSVGVRADVEVDVARVEVEPGDRFLLCSDGLSGLVPDAEMADVIQANSPDEAARTLVDIANERGGHDNVTVQIASIAGEPPPSRQAIGGAGARADGRTLAARHRHRAVVVVGAVLISGATALTLLWWLYRTSV